MTPRIVDKAAKKRNILQAAIPVFSEKGVANTKMIDIAKAAKIGKGTIYEYFSSKEDIFIHAFHHFFKGFEEELFAKLQEIPDPVQQLRALIRLSMNIFFDKQSDFAGIILEFWAEGIRTKDDALDKAIDLKAVYQSYRAVIIQIIETGMAQGLFRTLNSVPYASLLMAAMDGFMLQWVLEPDIFDLEEVTEALCEGLLQGIRKTEAKD